MPEELSLIGIVEGGLPAQLLHLPDVVQDCRRHQHVAVEFREDLRRLLAQLHDLGRVLEKSADVGVMKRLSARRGAEALPEVLVAEEPEQELPQMGLDDRLDHLGEAVLQSV